MTEFKWERLRQARERFAALKMLDKPIELATQERLRVDTLIWDIYDHRHQIPGRDDAVNLQRMYYRLFKNVPLRRWPTGSTWHLYPDENTALDWMTVQDYLDPAGSGKPRRRKGRIDHLLCLLAPSGRSPLSVLVPRE